MDENRPTMADENPTPLREPRRLSQEVSANRAVEPASVAQMQAKRASGSDSGLQYVNVVGVHDPEYSKVRERPFREHDVRPGVLEFSEVSNPDTILKICRSRVPGWSAYPPEQVCIKQVTEGLTNQIFKVYLEPADDATSHNCVLFRIYGTEMKEFIDPVVELRVFKMLSQYEIAPKLVAEGQGWRIEEWHFALPLPTRVLTNPSIYCQVASQLGRFHKLQFRPDFPPESMIDRTPSVFIWLKKWAVSASRVAMPTKEWTWRLEAMVTEAQWLTDYISERMIGSIVSGQGWDVVFCHNDCQENNLLQTQYGLRLIDFEYSHFNFQAYDIANFFNEFCIDYMHPSHPFFTLDLTRYPSLSDQRLFASVYLSEYLKTPVRPWDHNMTDPLIEAIEIFSMASNLVWALWSVLRSPQAFTFDEFDFMGHGSYRFDMYKRTQRSIQTNNTITSADNPSVLADSVQPIQKFSIPGPPKTASCDVTSNINLLAPRANDWKWLLGGVIAGCAITTGMLHFLKR